MESFTINKFIVVLLFCIYGHANTVTGEIRVVGYRCFGVKDGNTANGTPIEISDCNGTPAQHWTIESDGTIRALSKCLDVLAGLTGKETPLQLWDCNGTDAQNFKLLPDGQIVNIKSNLCVDVKNPANSNGARLQMNTCNGSANEKFIRSEYGCGK